MRGFSELQFDFWVHKEFYFFLILFFQYNKLMTDLFLQKWNEIPSCDFVLFVSIVIKTHVFGMVTVFRLTKVYHIHRC